MILYKDNRFITNSEHPDDDWVGDADFVIPDDSEPAHKIIALYPNFKIILDDDGIFSDVEEISPAPLPTPPPSDHERLEALEAAFLEFISEVL